MSEISIELKKQLDMKQQHIIQANDKYILVSACPGSGKTFTIVKKIEQQLSELKDHQGIIACSYTNEASNELKNRINKSFDLSLSFIGTIDSLVKSIICVFLNRTLEVLNINKPSIIINETSFPVNDKEINRITRFYDSNEKTKKDGNNYCKKWLSKLLNGNYEISFPSYIFATNIVKNKFFNDFFAERYPTIYIDEAQDLNYFQHLLLNSIKTYTNASIIMVGDPFQSIYQFRGARPELFKNLVTNGYIRYSIDISIRCHPNIIFYANKIYNLSKKKDIIEEVRVKMIKRSDLTLNFLQSLSNGMFLLTDDNNTAILLYEEFKADFDIIYTKKLDIKGNDYNLNRDIIDELIKYYLNYDNKLDKYKSPVDKLLQLIHTMNKKIKKQQLSVNGREITDYLQECLKLIDIDISGVTLNEINSKLIDEKYKYHYYIVEKDNRIMTIHNSKGLESNNVIILLNSNFNDPNNEEFKNKLFVAITRAKENVFIITENNKKIETFINELLREDNND